MRCVLTTLVARALLSGKSLLALGGSGLGLGLSGSLGLGLALPELLEGGLTALGTLVVGLLLDLVHEGHVHANNSALGLLDDAALAAGKSLSGALLVETAVDGSPAELGVLLLLEEVRLVLAGPETEDLGGRVRGKAGTREHEGTEPRRHVSRIKRIQQQQQ